MTLTDLRTQARYRCNQENSQFVTDGELTGYINFSAFELYDLLVQKYGSYYFHNTYTFNLISGQSSYNLPNDFYKLAGIEIQIDSQNYQSLQRFNWSDRNKFMSGTFFDWGAFNLGYSLVGNQVRLFPNVSITNQIRLDYVPFMTTMVADSDSFNGFNGWEDYIIVDAARKMALKENDEALADRLLQEKQLLIKRIESAAAARDAANPKTISNINSQNSSWPFGRY